MSESYNKLNGQTNGQVKNHSVANGNGSHRADEDDYPEGTK